MITQKQWSLIHKLRRQGWGIRQLARSLKLARNTVRTVLRQETFKSTISRASRKTGLTPFKSRMPELAVQAGYNAKEVYKDLLCQGYTGSYQQVVRMVRPLREKAHANWLVSSTAGPGRKGHVYWGTTLAGIGETKVRVHIFLMVLGYSGMFTGTFVLDETMPTFLKCHKAAFHYFMGVPQQIVYDNPKKVVVQFDTDGHPLEWNPMLKSFHEGLGIKSSVGKYDSMLATGRVVSILNHLKGNFLCGQRFDNMKILNAKFKQWRDQVMNSQFAGETSHRRMERFREDQRHLLTWNEEKLA